jgi:hypothetical protein
MTRPAPNSLWTRLRHAWLAAGTETPADPRLAAEAGIAPSPERLTVSPLVGAYLR